MNDLTEKSLTIHNFIFSNLIFFRVSRHLAFWLAIPLVNTALTLVFNPTFSYNFDGILAFVGRSLLPMTSTYATLYFLIPKYLLRKRYGSFIFGLFILCSLLPIFYFVDPVEYLIDPEEYRTLRSPLFDGVFNKADRNFLKMCHLVGWWAMVYYPGIASTIKLMKLYYIENSENKRLHSLKVNHEINLIKSQLNSRFLLNALQSIRDHVRKRSPAASGLLLQLSELLSYILYENSEKPVPLLKEIAMIEGYLFLVHEGVRDKINTKVTCRGNMDEMKIVPRLLLPLVESCFDNSPTGPSKSKGLFIDFNVDGLVLTVTLTIDSNQSLNFFQKSPRVNIVRERLVSYYGTNHHMEVLEKNQKQIVHLTLTP
jgi:sensor histidine kinase YesM